jgi:hypothetical protein
MVDLEALVDLPEAPALRVLAEKVVAHLVVLPEALVPMETLAKMLEKQVTTDRQVLKRVHLELSILLKKLKIQHDYAVLYSEGLRINT